MSETWTYSGACHCGAVSFDVTVSDRVALRCNCSICDKKGFLHVIVEKDAFHLKSGADSLTTYTFNTQVAQHTFCKVCGIHGFYTPRSHPDGVSVNLRALEGTAETDFQIQPFDGRNWEANIEKIRV